MRALSPHRLAAAFAAASPPVQAGVYATVAAVAFSVMSTLIRYAGTNLHPFEVVFFRNLISLLFMAPWLYRIGFSGLHKDRIGLHAVRAGQAFIKDGEVLLLLIEPSVIQHNIFDKLF